MKKRKNPEWKIPKSQGNPFYATADALQAKIDEYFKTGMRIKTVIVGPATSRMAVDIPIPTISGLCHFLGFDSRQSFYDMEGRPELSYTIKKARLLIEQDYEEDLKQGLGAGAIFALKNFGWKDEHSVVGAVVHKHEISVVDIEARAAEIVKGRQCLGSRN